FHMTVVQSCALPIYHFSLFVVYHLYCIGRRNSQYPWPLCRGCLYPCLFERRYYRLRDLACATARTTGICIGLGCVCRGRHPVFIPTAIFKTSRITGAPALGVVRPRCYENPYVNDSGSVWGVGEPDQPVVGHIDCLILNDGFD